MGKPLVQILADRGNHVDITTRKERENQQNVHYIVGNAHENAFIETVLKNKYDAIVDFMIYPLRELEERIALYLDRTDQYVFLSSSRVYANSPDQRITEEWPRILDITTDETYLATNEYALAKAREESLIRNTGKRNFTIVRPYITYNDERLQLGVYEKEDWLQRALAGKKILFSKDIAQKQTTLTYGYDVALRMADLIGNPKAMGETFHIAMGRSISWEDVLEVYLDVLEEQLGKRPEVVWTESCDPMKEKYAHYQVHCDRLYNREFSDQKIQNITKEEQPFVTPEVGLRKCLENFLKGNREFRDTNWKQWAVMDKITKERTPILKIPKNKDKLRYLVYRYFLKA